MKLLTKRNVKKLRKKDLVKIADALNAVDNAFPNSGLNVYQQRMMQMGGGVRNPLSGAGGMTDKSQFFDFIPIWLNDRAYIERVCAQSWLAERFIELPVDDMFAKPRKFSNDVFRAECDRVELDRSISDAFKLGRQYGTALMWVVTKEANQATPLNLDSVRRGDLVNIIVIDRNDCWVKTRNTSVTSPNFNKPEIYTIRVDDIGTIDVHYTRIKRFDGIKQRSINKWQSYERDWGVSKLVPVMMDIFNDSSVVQAITHLVQEASIPVHKIDGLNDILCRGKLPDEPDVEDIMAHINMKKAIYHTMFIDESDSFDRTSVNFTNIPDLMDRFPERFAMASGISVTRFLGKSASGLNATGEGDQRNDSKNAHIRQMLELKPIYDWVDPIISRSCGAEVPEYTFPPLFELTEKELSDIDLSRSRTAKLMVDIGSWSPLDAKEYLEDGTHPTGELSEDASRATTGISTDPEGDSNNSLIKEEPVADKV